MEYFHKYQKYKNKYLELKYKQIGGAKTPYQFSIPLQSGKVIVISYEYDTRDRFLYTIYNFKICINDNDINLINRNFIINKFFFDDYLNPTPQMIQNYSIESPEPFNFDNCDNINTPFTTRKYFRITNSDINEDDCIKKFIESYFRKNICIVIQNQSIMTTELVCYPNIMKLYILLTIIHNYFKIEHTKLTDLNEQKYIKIYKSIPKYLESDIGNEKISFFVNNIAVLMTNNRYGIDGTKLKIVFDSGNSNRTLVSVKFLQYLGYYDASGEPNQQYINNVIFQKFMIAVKGVGSGLEIGETNLVLLSFKFNDQKLNNDKTYNITSVITNGAVADLLLGQDTILELYEDGYSIKYHKPFGTAVSKIVKDQELFRKLLIPFDTNIMKKVLDDYTKGSYHAADMETIVEMIYVFITGRSFEKSNIRAAEIIIIKENICLFIKSLNKKAYLRTKFYDIFSLKPAGDVYNKECLDSIFLN